MNQKDKDGLVLSAAMFVGALIGIGLNFTTLSPLCFSFIVSTIMRRAITSETAPF